MPLNILLFIEEDRKIENMSMQISLIGKIYLTPEIVMDLGLSMDSGFHCNKYYIACNKIIRRNEEFEIDGRNNVTTYYVVKTFGEVGSKKKYYSQVEYNEWLTLDGKRDECRRSDELDYYMTDILNILNSYLPELTSVHKESSIMFTNDGAENYIAEVDLAIEKLP